MRNRGISIIAGALLALLAATAVPVELDAQTHGTSQMQAGHAPIPFPVFNFDSLRYFVHYPPAAVRRGDTGAARLIVEISAKGKITVRSDARNNEAFEDALRNGLGYVTFRPARAGSKPVASAVVITALFRHDNAYASPVPYVDIVLDSVAHAAGPMVRMKRHGGAVQELEPVYNELDLAGNIVHYEGMQHTASADTVVVRALIGRDGAVAGTYIDHSTNPQLDLSAQEAVKATRFVPALNDGMPVALWVQVPVKYRWGAK